MGMALNDASEQMFQLISKMGEDNTGYAEPDKEESGTVNARWGQESAADKDDSQSQFSNGVYDEFIRGREDFLGRHFAEFGSASSDAKKTVGENFQEKSYEASKPTLQKGVDVPKAETVLEKSKNLLDA